jgi:hypothetical protein
MRCLQVIAVMNDPAAGGQTLWLSQFSTSQP